MRSKEVKRRLQCVLRDVAEKDRYLLENDLSERCIASRLAMYLQNEFNDYSVDIEYNREGFTPKRLNLCEECANSRGKDNQPLVVPDVIVHRRGPNGPNVLVLELKKTTNQDPRQCDRQRVLAFRLQLNYQCGALIECETRHDREPGIEISEWFDKSTDHPG